MADTEAPIEAPIVETVTIQAVPKKPRSEAQLLALEAARKKAYEIRAEKSALKKQDEASKTLARIEAQKKPIDLDTTQHSKEEVPPGVAPPVVEDEEEPEVVYRKKPPKKKRVVVVQEESSSDSEIEVRLPKAKAVTQPKVEKTPDEIRYEKAYNRLFSVDTL